MIDMNTGIEDAGQTTQLSPRMRRRAVIDAYVLRFREVDWAYWGTFNLRPRMHRKAAVRHFEEWVRQIAQRENAEIHWLRIGERGPEQNLYHYHVLISKFTKTTVYEAQQLWFGLAGELHLSSYKRDRRALEYSLKSLEDTDDPDIEWHLPDNPRARI